MMLFFSIFLHLLKNEKQIRKTKEERAEVKKKNLKSWRYVDMKKKKLKYQEHFTARFRVCQHLFSRIIHKSLLK